MTKLMDNVGESFSYVFKDPNWFGKIAMGALFIFLSVFLVGIPFVVGYMVWTTRNVIRKEGYPLPPWMNFSDMFVTGIKMIWTYILFYIPFWIIVAIPFYLVFYMVFMQGMWAYFVLFIVLYFILILLSIIYSLFLMPVYVRFAMTDNVGQTLRLYPVWRFFKKNFTNILLIMVLVWVAGLIGSLGAIVFFIGMLFTMMYAYLVQAHLLGKLELNAQAEGEGIMKEDTDERNKEK